MRRLLCVSLCLGLMVSACKRNFIQEYLDAMKANAKGGESAGTTTNTTNTNTVTKKDKEAVLKACLPFINTKMVELWKDADSPFFLRRSTVWQTTAADPLVVLYTGSGLPLAFVPGSEVGLGADAAALKTNLEAMARSEVIQKQFVPRKNNASGWRVHISKSNTDVRIPWSEPGEAPVAPNDSIIIYDPEGLQAANKAISFITNQPSLETANHQNLLGGWFECEVDDTTQDVTFEYAQAKLT